VIDVLSTNMQAHGSEKAGPPASLQKAEFMPSSSSNSFAAYLDRISHSADGNNREPNVKEVSYSEKNSPAHYAGRASEGSSEKTSPEVKSNETARESTAAQRPRKTGESVDQADRADQANKTDQADQADKKRADAENREHSDKEARKNKNSSEAEKGEQEDKLQQENLQIKEAAAQKGSEKASERVSVSEDKNSRENEETKKGDVANTLSDQLKNAEKAVQDTSRNTSPGAEENAKAKRAKVVETKTGNTREAKAAEESAKMSAETLEALEDSSRNGKTAAAADEVGLAKDLRARDLKIAGEGNSKEASLRRSGDGQHDSSSGRDARSRHVNENEGRPKLTIIDKRGASAHNSNNESGAGSGRRNSGFQLLSSSGNTAHGANSENGDSLQVIQVQLRGEGAQAPSSAQTGSRSAESGLRGQLQQQLQDHLNKDIVKRSSIMIRENGSGEIKLDLKPDTLGQVRIRITMENNHIAGKIFVENSSVKEAFDQNMQQLYRAFKEHGFENAALNVSVGDQGREQRERERSQGVQPKVSLQQALALDEQSSSTSASSGELRLVDVMA